MNQKIASVTLKRGDQNYSLITVWAGKYPGTYSIALDKGTDKYPAAGFLDALKWFAARECFVNLRIESQAEQRGGSPRTDRREPARDDFSDENIPF